MHKLSLIHFENSLKASASENEEQAFSEPTKKKVHVPKAELGFFFLLCCLVDLVEFWCLWFVLDYLRWETIK